jgi:hypothetical protein
MFSEVKPRKSYVGREHRIPGGNTFCSAQVTATITASGVSEGKVENVFAVEGYFATNNASKAWICMKFPVSFRPTKYGFAHGHPKPNYYRATNWRLEGIRSDGKPVTLIEHNQRLESVGEWSLSTVKQSFDTYRLVSTGCQEDNVYMLCVKAFKIWGAAF